MTSWIPTFRRACVAMLACAAMLPAGVVSAANYIPDPRWREGQIAPAAFASPLSNNYVGRKMARLSDGDVVVAGTVPPLSGNAALGAIGLARYKADGTGRRAWTNPGANSHFNNQYVIRPGEDFVRIVAVTDLFAYGERLYVLADIQRYRLAGVGVPLAFDGYGSAIYVFGTDGSFKHSHIADSDLNTGSDRSVWGSGVAVTMSANHPEGNGDFLYYLGRKKVGSVERIVFRRYSVSASGVLTPLTNAIHPAIPECPSNIHCSAFGIALGGAVDLHATPRIWITGSRYQECPGAFCWSGWNAYLQRLDALNGAPVGNFQYLTEGMEGRGRALAVLPRAFDQDDVYVLAERDRSCKSGMIVFARRKDAPTTWQKTLGGSATDSLLCSLEFANGWIRHDIPTAIALQGTRLAVTGYGITGGGLCTPGQTCPEDRIDGSIAVLNAQNGNLISPATSSSDPQPLYYRYTDTPGGPRTRHSVFHDITGTGDDTFTVAGYVRYPETHATPSYRGKMQYATLRVRESTSGEGPGWIFIDGFE